jgi:hypothetical protein
MSKGGGSWRTLNLLPEHNSFEEADSGPLRKPRLDASTPMRRNSYRFHRTGSAQVQDDSAQVIEINGKGVRSSGRAAPMNDGVADLRRKASDMLRVVTIFRMIPTSG